MDGETKATEIQELTVRSNTLSESVDSWNTWIVLSLIIAAVAAVVVAATTRMGFVRAKQLTAIQEKLLQAKDNQLAIDLKEKDVKIADANNLAATAEQRAAEANLALEQFKAPRTLTHEQQARIAEKLRQFGAIPFDFAVQPAPESQAYMEYIGEALKLAGWHRIAYEAPISVQSPNRPNAGVVIATGIEIRIALSKKPEWSHPALVLAEALRLEGANIVGISAFEGPTDKAIHILVGGKL